MKNSWEKVFNNDERISKHVFELLVKLDGNEISDSFSSKDWLDYIKNLYSLLKIKKRDSIFEFGCGCGAFLYPHYIRGGKVGGRGRLRRGITNQVLLPPSESVGTASESRPTLSGSSLSLPLSSVALRSCRAGTGALWCCCSVCMFFMLILLLYHFHF